MSPQLSIISKDDWHASVLLIGGRNLNYLRLEKMISIQIESFDVSAEENSMSNSLCFGLRIYL
jgi:hypothetical protein